MKTENLNVELMDRLEVFENKLAIMKMVILGASAVLKEKEMINESVGLEFGFQEVFDSAQALGIKIQECRNLIGLAENYLADIEKKNIKK